MNDILTWVYAAAMGIGVFYTLLQLIAQGFDGVLDAFHIHLDFNGHSGDPGITVLALAWFLTSFGAAGLITQLTGIGGAILSLMIASASGLTFGAIAQIVFVRYLSQTTSTHVSTSSLIGKMAEVSTPIEPDHLGQILLVAQGSRMTFPARATKRDIAIPRGQLVRITAISGSVAHVEPANGSED